MLQEGECSDFQQLTTQQHFITRQNYFKEGKSNIGSHIQKSLWDLQKFKDKQLKKTSLSNLAGTSYMNFILHIVNQIPKTFEKELPVNDFLTQLKILIDKDLQANNTNFVQNSYVFFCIVFLQQCIFFILSLINSFKIADLNKELLTHQLFVAISNKKAQKESEFIFTLRLVSKQGEQDTSSTLNSKEKGEEQNKKNALCQKQVDQNQSDPLSVIESPVRQKPQEKQNQSEQDLLMEFFKKLFITTNFIILVSKKSHIYLINKAEKLGQGGFGGVFKSEQLKLVNGHSSQSTWAIKELKKNIQIGNTIGQDRQHQMLTCISQLSGMKMLSGRNIIEVQEVINFNNKKYIIYQYCPAKDLRRFIKNNDRQLNKKHIFMIIEQLAATLALIHYQLITNQTDMDILDGITQDGEIETDNMKYFENRMYFNTQVGIIHRDLKPTNILVSYFSETHIKIKLIDWAFSKRTLTQIKTCAIYCGTINYQAPEVLNRKLYCCKVDVWAFGVIVYQLLTGRQFLQKEDKDKLKKDDEFVKNKLKEMSLRNDKNFSELEVNFWKQLIRNCLEFNPQNRYSSRQALDYLRNFKLYKPFTKQSIKYIQQLKMMRASYFYHHNSILQLTPSIIRAKILNKISVHVENALQVIYQKFTQDKYWNSEKPQVTWEVQKKFGRYKQKRCKQETFDQCIQMLQNCPCQKYPQYKAFKELVEKIKKRYFQLR